MEAERKNSPTLSKSKQPVKTEWGSQSVVFTYFQGDLNSVIDEHFSRALSNAKNPQDLSTKYKSEDVILKNDGHMSPHQWNFSSHWTKSYQSSPATNTPNSDLNLSAAATDHHQASVLRNSPIQPADVWHFPSIANPSLTDSGYPRALPDPHMVQGPMSDGKYGSLLDFLQQERCPASSQESIMKQSSSSACITGSARLQNMSQSLTPGGERKASSYQSPGNPSINLASSGTVSLISLSILSYERYVRVLRRHMKVNVSSYQKSCLFIAGSWFYSLLWTLPPLFGWSSYGPEGPGTTCSVAWHSRSPNNISYIICLFIFCLILPLLTMIYCYGKIMRAIKMVSRFNMTTVQKRERHILFMVVSMVTCYLLCWMPYGIVSLIATFGKPITPTVSIVPSILAKTSTFVNPVLYVLLNKQFYRCFIALIKCGPFPRHTENILNSKESQNFETAGQVTEIPLSQVPEDERQSKNNTQRSSKNQKTLVVHYKV